MSTHPRLRVSDHAPRTGRDRGFTLIELLVVIIIIGILAAIAIPVFLNQRQKGVDASLKSDLRNASSAVESWTTDNPQDRDGPATSGTPLTNYTTASDSLATSIALPGGASTKVSPGNYMSIYTHSTGNGYCIATANTGSSKKWTRPGLPTSAQASIYDSTAGGLTTTPSAGCAIVDAPTAPVYTAGTGGVPCPHYSVMAMKRAFGAGDWEVALNGTSDPMVDVYTRSISRTPIGAPSSSGPSISTYWVFAGASLVAGDTVTVSVTGDDYTAPNGTTSPDTVGCGSITIAMPSTTGAWGPAVTI